MQVFVRILEIWRTFIARLAQCLCPLYNLAKKGHIWNCESKLQATYEQARILVKQIKALGISQAGLPWVICVCDSRKCQLGPVAETTEGKSVPRVLVPALEGGKTLICPQTATALAVYTAYHGKNFPSFQGVDWGYVPSTHICHDSKAQFD